MILILTILPSVTTNTRHQEHNKVRTFLFYHQSREQFGTLSHILNSPLYLLALHQGLRIFIPHQGPLSFPAAQCRCTPSWKSQTCSLASGAAARPFTVKPLYLCL